MAEKAGGTCSISPTKALSASAAAAALGRTSEVAVTTPSRSKLAGVAPQAMGERGGLLRPPRSGKGLGGSPGALGRMPLARGSRVPAWPAFWALNRRRIRLTAWVEPRSTGLSSTIQPETGSPLRLRPIVGLGVAAPVIARGRFQV